MSTILNNDKMKATLRAVKQAYKSNDIEAVERIEKSVFIGKSRPELFELHPKLGEIYDTVGNNPLESPKLYVTNPDFVVNEYLSIVEKELDVDLGALELEDAINFAGLVWTKVHSYYTIDGVIKSTPTTEKAKMPTSTSIRKLSQMEVDATEAKAKTYDGYDADIDEISELTAAISGIDDELTKAKRKEVFAITGIKKKDLTEWEQDLLVQDVMSYTADSIARGKSSFKGYL